MSERLWVVNASPIISLASIDQAHILSNSCDRMIIPQAVEHEILDEPDDDLAKQWIKTTGQHGYTTLDRLCRLLPHGISAQAKALYFPGAASIRNINRWLMIWPRGSLPKPLRPSGF